jgi:Ca-dependent carbohydrate-binding module xylan-binding
MSSYKGTYASPTSNSPMSQAWAAENAKGHGKLGELFYQNTFDIRGTSGTHNGMKMGDSNSFFYLIDSADNNNPAANGWGGKYRLVKEGYWTDPTDGAFSISGSNGAHYVYEDRSAWMGDFAKRLDWLKGSTIAPLPPIEPTNPTPADPVLTDDALVIRVSGEDAGLAKDPTITVLVDGVSKGTFAVTADHSDGAWQTIAIDGAWSKTSDHKVEVKYYDGQTAQSVFLDSVALNGDVNGTDVSMLGRTFKNYYLGDIL